VEVSPKYWIVLPLSKKTCRFFFSPRKKYPLVTNFGRFCFPPFDKLFTPSYKKSVFSHFPYFFFCKGCMWQIPTLPLGKVQNNAHIWVRRYHSLSDKYLLPFIFFTPPFFFSSLSGHYSKAMRPSGACRGMAHFLLALFTCPLLIFFSPFFRNFFSFFPP